ncbi:MAG: flagellar hook-basal body complex protein FliE [Acidobacteria bacterium]|nr:flagellar hook-basal body complex protein FliE [Acidobacteriota bacterium]
MAITSIGTSAPAAVPGAATRGAATEGGDFGASLAKLLEAVESSSGEANRAVSAMTDGSGDVHTAMLALQKAEISMQLTVQVRNKLVQAYQDLMRMPI